MRKIDILKKWKEQFNPDPKIIDIIEKSKKKEYNQKEAVNYDFTGAKASYESGAKVAGIDTSKDKNNSVGISTIASLAINGAEIATKAAQEATKVTTNVPQKLKRA